MTGPGGLKDPLKQQEEEAKAAREAGLRDINQGRTVDWMRPGQTVLDPGAQDVEWGDLPEGLNIWGL